MAVAAAAGLLVGAAIPGAGIATTAIAAAQERAQVEQAVHGYFDALVAGDPEALLATMPSVRIRQQLPRPDVPVAEAELQLLTIELDADGEAATVSFPMGVTSGTGRASPTPASTSRCGSPPTAPARARESTTPAGRRRPSSRARPTADQADR